jgi:anti-anti-sigma regulatory factor
VRERPFFVRLRHIGADSHRASSARKDVTSLPDCVVLSLTGITAGGKNLEKLVATIEQRRSGARLIKLAGVLDEDNGLDALVEKVGTGTALINLAGVERIDAGGLGDWSNWLAALEAKGIRPIFVACSPAVVEQLNRNKDFSGNGIVKSFHVSYYCGSCGTDKVLLVHISDMGATPHSAPPCTCDSCGGEMTFIDESGTYFDFVRAQQKKALVQAKNEPERGLARGSNAAVTVEHVKHVSSPRLTPRDSRPSLSAFQVPGHRPSERDVMPPRMAPPSERPYIVLVILLLLATVGVLAFMLLVR